MITHFNYDNRAESGVVFASILEQIEMLHEEDTALAGEFAIAALHLILTNEINSDNFTIKLALKQMEVVAAKNRSKRDNKVKADREAKIKAKKLDIIADLHCQGLTQREIAAEVGESQQTVSNRLSVIRSDFPELLEDTKNTNDLQEIQENYKEYKEYKPNVNVTVNVNDNVNDNVNVNENIDEVPSYEETSFDYIQIWDGYSYYEWQDRYWSEPGTVKLIMKYPEENAAAIAKAQELQLI